MKKIIFFVLSFILIFLISINVNALDNTEEIWNNLNNDTKDYLDELGINEISFNQLFELSPTRVIKFLFNLTLNKTRSLKDNFAIVFIILILSSIASSFSKQSDKLGKLIDYTSNLIIMSFVMVPIGRIITDAATVIKNTTVFINIYLPVMTGIIVAAKSPALAITYNSFTIFLSNVIAVVSDKIFTPLISIIFSFNIISSFSIGDFQNRLSKTIRRLITVILSLFSTVFTGLLTTQSILASSSDSLVLKGIKFVSGTFIPIVGGGVGDALSSVFSSFLIMKNTLGIFIIIVIIIINLPVMIELLIWYFFFGVCSIMSSLLGLENITEILDSLSSTISLLNIIVFFITFILVISTGIIIVMGK